MAANRIKSVSRPRYLSSATNAVVSADFLRVHVINDEDQEGVATLPFATHAGLQAEWEAGTVTTVLNAAVQAWIDSNLNTADDALPSGTRTGKEGFTYTP